VLDVVLAPGFLEAVDRKGRRLWEGLAGLVGDYPSVFEDVRGSGLLLGLKCVIPQAEIQAACREEGLLALTAGDNVLRLAPPLVITERECDEALAMMRRAAERCVRPAAAVA
jgi:acetylornithine/N-succinyldiaminopimelate aminotransferase